MRGWTVFAIVIFAAFPIIFLLRPQVPGQLAALCRASQRLGRSHLQSIAVLGLLLCASVFLYRGIAQATAQPQ
jgi:hypothetical protein